MVMKNIAYKAKTYFSLGKIEDRRLLFKWFGGFTTLLFSIVIYAHSTLIVSTQILVCVILSAYVVFLLVFFFFIKRPRPPFVYGFA